MERFKKVLFLLVIISLSVVFFQCTKYKEPAPFFDGLFLEYDRSPGHRYKLIYNVHVLENNKYKILETDTVYITDSDKIEMYVDKNGRVYESSKERYEGKFSPIWIPVNEMEIGDKFDERKLIEREDKWEKWEVLVVKDTPTGGESYYDLNTGYWVGAFARTPRGAGKIVLVNTNADIPTVEE